MKSLVAKRNLSHVVSVDSAGTAGWHVGDVPDARTVKAAKARGYDLSGLRGRQVSVQDFDNYDFILAMDEDNLQALKYMCPKHYEGHLGLFLAFGDRQDYKEVPDPYYGGARGFETVLDLVESACAGLLNHIESR